MKTIPYYLHCGNMEHITPLAPHEVYAADENTRDSDISLHRHSFYELIYVTEGSGAHVIDEHSYGIEPGHVALICPYQAHEMRSVDSEGFSYRRCAFDLSLLLKYAEGDVAGQGMFDLDGTTPVTFLCTDQEREAFDVLFDSLEVEREIHPFGSALSANLALKMLILYLRCREHRGPVGSMPEANVWDALRLTFMRSCSPDLSLEAIADDMGWAPDRLKYELYESLDLPFKDILTDIRLRNAASLLLVFPDMNVLDIAKNVGFRSGATFFRAFERAYGMTPAAFRGKYLFRSLPAHHPAVPNALFANVLIYVYKNYRDDLKLAQLARRFKVNDQQLGEEFVRYTGLTLPELLTRVRIKKALGFLKCTNQPVDTIAAEVGFNTGRTFSRAFQKVTGMTPNAFRQS